MVTHPGLQLGAVDEPALESAVFCLDGILKRLCSDLSGSGFIIALIFVHGLPEWIVLCARLILTAQEASAWLAVGKLDVFLSPSASLGNPPTQFVITSLKSGSYTP